MKQVFVLLAFSCGIALVSGEERRRCNQATEKYLVEPDIFPISGRPKCEYLRCVNSYYETEKCPEGLGIEDIYIKRRNGKPRLKSRKPGNKHPCTKRTEACGLFEEAIRPDLSLCGMDLLIAADMSCSISDANKTAVINFIMNVISKFRIGSLNVKIAGFSFASKVNNIQTFKEGRNRPITLRNFEKMLRSDGKCHTVSDEALAAARDIYFTEKHGDRPSFKNVLLFITDGKAYKGKKVDQEMLSDGVIAIGAELRKSGILPLVLALPSRRSGKLVGMKEWEGIAEKQENILYLKSFKELEKKVQLIAEKSCVILNQV